MAFKIIKINPRSLDAGQTGITPTPSKKYLPKWYKEHKTFQGNSKKFELDSSGNNNATMKWCNPFTDAMSAGYMILLEQDIMVSDSQDLSKSAVEINWSRPGKWVDSHSKDQFSSKMVPQGFAQELLKFEVDWSFEVPKGYSLLYTHPLNRYDLPFIAMTGIVDSDTYLDKVNIPFFLREDFRGILEAGTPIAQIIPIKRESWKSQITLFDEKKSSKIRSLFHSKIYRSYKNQFWHRKDYS